MATENKILKSRIDYESSWNDHNPLIQPGEICFIIGSTDYRVNVSNTATNFLNCQLFQGTDTAGSTPGDGRIAIKKYNNTDFGAFTVNQSGPTNITLPNFVANAKEDFPIDGTKRFITSQWASPDTDLTDKLPQCTPVDLMLCIIRDWAALLESHGVNGAVADAQTACLGALSHVDLR